MTGWLSTLMSLKISQYSGEQKQKRPYSIEEHNFNAIHSIEDVFSIFNAEHVFFSWLYLTSAAAGRQRKKGACASVPGTFRKLWTLFATFSREFSLNSQLNSIDFSESRISVKIRENLQPSRRIFDEFWKTLRKCPQIFKKSESC